jgi:WD40 repeat protein
MPVLPNGKVMLAGGYQGGVAPYALKSVVLYDPTLNTWSDAASMATRRAYLAPILLPNGKVLAAGGWDYPASVNTYHQSAELYDYSSDTWTTSPNSMVSGGIQRAATLLPNGKILYAGGTNAGGYMITSEQYDYKTDTWTATANISQARRSAAIIVLQNGKALLAGGDLGSASAVAEIFDPAGNAGAGNWTATGSLVTASMSGMELVKLPDGNILLPAASDSAVTAFANAQIYNFLAGTWSATTSLPAARIDYTADLLPNGKVLVVGGSDGVPSWNAFTGAYLYQ